MLKLRYLSCILLLQACAQSHDENAVNWDTINYREMACAGNPGASGCKMEADDIATSGRSKGR